MSVYRNHRLFSDHYLAEILPKSKEWQEIDEEKLNNAFEGIRALYRGERASIASIKEPQLEDRWVRPILKLLDHFYDPQPSIPQTREGSKQPDYAFYPSREAINRGIGKAIGLGEAKRYGRPLDKKLKVDPEDIQNPSLQVSRYLWLSEVSWGILTDGRFWRLYERETSKKLDIFYEVDLDKIFQDQRKELVGPSIEDFKYFYLFFRREAFPGFLRRVYEESLDYARAVGEELKENVYQALRVLAEGFLKIPSNKLGPENIGQIHDNALIVLYRLLFILYAEYLKLLPLGENPVYTETYSLDAIKKETAKKLDNNVTLSHTGTQMWRNAKELFDVINNGNEELGVAPYNGGLFDPNKHPFLEDKGVGDHYIAKVIDLLSRSQDKAFIDYSSLEIRDLGTIYEGLLEYKPKVAEKDMKAIKEKGRLVWKAAGEAKGKKFIDEAKTGELYLVTDKGERKATGSYYTPDYIVKYIVENTLGPIIENKKKGIIKETEDLKRKIKRARGYNRQTYEKELSNKERNLADKILKIKVLDPAMGSGHFLVEATDYLAHALTEALSGEMFLETPKRARGLSDEKGSYEIEREEEDVRWARREIVERCIFGVDLNPLAVELSKLSLWLTTVSKGKPLNFLDHHFKCGNSLIGARVEDLNAMPVLKKRKVRVAEGQIELFDKSSFTRDIALAVGDFILLEGKPSNRVEDIKDKENILNKLNKERLNKYRKIGNLWTSIYFGNQMDSNLYTALSDYILGQGREIPGGAGYVEKAQQIYQERQFFHWEIEFPEVFFDKFGTKKDNPGFDVVVGNPPYDVISEKEQGRNVENEKFFFTSTSAYLPAIGHKLNSYRLFVSLGLNVLKKDGFHGFIVPIGLLSDDYAKGLRKFILTKNRLIAVEGFPQKDNPLDRVFLEAKLSTCAYIIQKSLPNRFSIRVHPGRKILNSSPILQIGFDQIQRFDCERLSIPCYPNMTDKDFLLALKLVQRAKGNTLTSYAISQQGEINITSDSEFLTDSAEGKIVLRGAHVNRYEFNEEPKQGAPVYLNVEKFLLSRRENTKVDARLDLRIGYQRCAAIDNWRRIIATIIEKGHFCSDTINFIAKPRNVNSFAILAMLSSSLWEWRFRLTSTTNHVNAYEIDFIPFPVVSFTTPKKERERLAAKAKELYFKVVEGGEPWITMKDILRFIEERLKKAHKSDPQLVKKHNADAINKNWQIPEGSLWEQSDVVHDILGFLAQKMIQYNKEIQKEVKSFLEWVEVQLKVKRDEDGNKGVEALTGKSVLKNFIGDYQKGEEHLSFEEFWEILERNKRKVEANLKSKEVYGTLKQEYERSLSRLLPLKEKLKKTDHIIDQVVYKLYGLTEREIKVVESCVKK